MDYTVSDDRLALLQANFFEFSFEGRQPDRAVFDTIVNPVEYHLIAGNYNWDDGAQVLTWIIESPLCDKGTALLIFWRAQPDFYTQFSSVEEADYEAEVYRLVRAIMGKWEAGFYQTSLIAYDPTGDPMAADIASRHPKEKWSIPAYLKQPLAGELEVLFD
jgi:hypothetical protein